jgi:hypothetical protein
LKWNPRALHLPIGHSAPSSRVRLTMRPRSRPAQPRGRPRVVQAPALTRRTPLGVRAVGRPAKLLPAPAAGPCHVFSVVVHPPSVRLSVMDAGIPSASRRRAGFFPGRVKAARRKLRPLPSGRTVPTGSLSDRPEGR